MSTEFLKPPESDEAKFDKYEREPIDVEDLFFNPKHPGTRRAAILIFDEIFKFSVDTESEDSVKNLIELVEESFKGCENSEILEAFFAVGDYNRAWESHTLNIEGGSKETPKEALERATDLIENIPGVQNFIDENLLLRR